MRLAGRPGAMKALTRVGVRSRTIMEWSIRVMAKHRERIPWGAVVTRRYSLDQANEALRAVEEREVLKAAIVPNR